VELPLALAIGLLFAAGVYSILRPNLIRMVIGFGLISCGGFTLDAAAPFVTDPDAVAGLMDPLPPDIVLTAIVISFAVGALFLTICYVVYRDYGTDDPERLPLPALDDETFKPRAGLRGLPHEE
jgi:multisubunit Na+/H+ antiporter MnhC subunit